MKKQGKFYSNIAHRYINYEYIFEDGILTYKSNFVCEREIDLRRWFEYPAKELYKIIEFDIKLRG